MSILANGAASKMLAVQPDRVLCTLALRGNAAAFEVLYSRYHRSIYAFIYHLLGRGANAEDAEDLAQDTFGSAFDKLDARRENGSFKAWLYTIARNRTFDHIKSDKFNASDEFDTEVESNSGASAELNAEQRAQMLWLVGALHELPERQRQALVMRELGGMSYDEIASSIEATVPSVKQLINRARGSVTSAAALAGYSPRNLDKSLQAIAPLFPIAASSAALAALGIGGGSAAGVGAGVSAGVGGFSAATKVVTVAVTVAVVGGGAAGVTEVTHDGSSRAPKDAIVTDNARHANAPAGGDLSAHKGTYVFRVPLSKGGAPGSLQGDVVHYNIPTMPGNRRVELQAQSVPVADGLVVPIDHVSSPPHSGTQLPAGAQPTSGTHPVSVVQPPSNGPSVQQNEDDGSVALPDYNSATPQGEGGTGTDSEEEASDGAAPGGAAPCPDEAPIEAPAAEIAPPESAPSEPTSTDEAEAPTVEQ